jgi:hypothetical protein
MGRGVGAGAKGRQGTVSAVELAKHNKVGDAWISIHGKVRREKRRGCGPAGVRTAPVQVQGGVGGAAAVTPLARARGPTRAAQRNRRTSLFPDVPPPSLFASPPHQVYDISTWTDHPGGRVILSAAGQDATDTYRAFHSLRADGMLKKELESRVVGVLEEPAAAAAPAKGSAAAPKSYVNVPFEEGYRELYKTIKERKLLEAR